jgi:hypothetical protein
VAVEGEDNNNTKINKLAIYIIQNTNFTDNISTVVLDNSKEVVTVNIKQNTVKTVISHHLNNSNNKALEASNTRLHLAEGVREVVNVSIIKLGLSNTIPMNKGRALKTTHTFNTFRN